MSLESWLTSSSPNPNFKDGSFIQPNQTRLYTETKKKPGGVKTFVVFVKNGSADSKVAEFMVKEDADEYIDLLYQTKFGYPN